MTRPRAKPTSPSSAAWFAPSRGQRKRCPMCERIRQGGMLLMGSGSKPKAKATSTTSPSHSAGVKARGLGLGRGLSLVLLAGVLLQLFFVARIALMAVVDPESTTFERSNLWRVMTTEQHPGWQQQWVPDDQIADTLKRAVIASEDSRFTEHTGVEWEAIEKAWERNAKAMEAAADADDVKRPAKPVVIRGGSTITQQLAKNLLLSGERTLVRKGQELVLTKLLEALLSKPRILELYLNHAEWGDGVFGAEAAARHYFKKPAKALSAQEAARLAVMLPRPKFFEDRPNSRYLHSQTRRIMARMRHVKLPQ